MKNVATAAAIGLVTGISGGVIGYFIARLLIERQAIAEGPAKAKISVIEILQQAAYASGAPTLH